MATPDTSVRRMAGDALVPADRARSRKMLHAELPSDARPLGLPAPWAGLAWRPLAPVRNLGKPRVYVAPSTDGDVVCKDASAVRGWLMRRYRGRTLRREAAILERLAGVPGVPRLLARWPTGFAMAAVPGRMLTTWSAEAPPPASCFDALDRIVAEIHARGVVIGDLHRRNVLVDETGRTSLVDFEVAFDATRGPLSPLRGLGMTLDRLAAARQRARCGAPLSVEQVRLLRSPPALYRWTKALKRRAQLVKRRRRRTHG